MFIREVQHLHIGLMSAGSTQIVGNMDPVHLGKRQGQPCREVGTGCALAPTDIRATDEPMAETRLAVFFGRPVERVLLHHNPTRVRDCGPLAEALRCGLQAVGSQTDSSGQTPNRLNR